jgi:hypothetical protein
MFVTYRIESCLGIYSLRVTNVYNQYTINHLFHCCSDDSDQDISNDLTGDKKEVLEYLSTATIGELRVMPHCSQKKAEAIIEHRPFTGWKDLVSKAHDYFVDCQRCYVLQIRGLKY